MSNNIVTQRLVVNRYVKSLFSFAVTAQKTQEIKQDFTIIKALISQSGQAKAIMLNPFITVSKQQELLKVVNKHFKLHKITQNFFNLLIKNRRLYLFPNISKIFDKHLIAHNDELKVDVTSVSKLSDQQKQEITDLIAKKYNKKVIFNNIVDSNIIGGLIIKINNHMIDCSISEELNRFIAGSKQSLLTFN
jgi:F-type H+-transporting ATPase subunit delta